MGFKPRPPRCYLNISYSCQRWEWGELDEPLAKIVGREEGGAGTGFGYRDISFYFATKPAAERARERVIAHIKKNKWKGVKVSYILRIED